MERTGRTPTDIADRLLEVTHLAHGVVAMRATARTVLGRPADDARIAREVLRAAAAAVPVQEAARAADVLRRMRRSIAEDVEGGFGRPGRRPAASERTLADALAVLIERHTGPAMMCLSFSAPDLRTAAAEVAEAIEPGVGRAIDADEAQALDAVLRTIAEALRGALVAA